MTGYPKDVNGFLDDVTFELDEWQGNPRVWVCAGGHRIQCWAPDTVADEGEGHGMWIDLGQDLRIDADTRVRLAAYAQGVLAMRNLAAVALGE